MSNTINLDKVRTFKYGMRAIDTLEKKLKTPVAKLDMDNLTMEQLATVLWAGLVHEDRNLTPDGVIDLIDEYSSIGEIASVMGEAFQSAFVPKNAERAVTETENPSL